VNLRVVPEHEVKAMLAAHGVRVPQGTTDLDAIDGLRAPLVLKAFGPHIVHKSDIGGVRLGLTHAEVAAAAADMRARLSPAGLLVEEQLPAGIELIVGVVDRGYGPMVAVGMGGTLTEVLDDVVLRCAPVTLDDAHAMLAELRGAPVLQGTRGARGVDLQAVAATVVAVCDTALALGPALAELECNPVIAHADGAVAVDARLLLHDPVPTIDVPPATDFTALFAPRGVAIAGASATKETFGNRFIDAYRSVGWTDGLVAIHPTATEVGGLPAYASVADVPVPLDYVVAAVPASSCAALVRSAAGKAPFVHVISGGFSEAGADGKGLEAELRDTARASGVRVLGPNCMGTFSPGGRQTFQLNVPTVTGNVSIISQSGGLAGDIIKVGDLRGVRFSKLVTMGNSIDVTPGEMCNWFVDDPDTQVIGLYLEDPRNGASLVQALRRARGTKPAVALVGGLSRQGGRAVASHTGSRAGDRRGWHAHSARTRVTVVQTLEELLSSIAYLQRWAHTPGNGAATTLVIGVGGGASVLTTDACDRAGLTVTPVDADVQATLRGMGYGVGTSVANPIEIPFGPAAPADAFARVLSPILAAQAYGDVLLHFNVQAYFSFGTDGGSKLLPVIESVRSLVYPGTRVALVARNLDTAPGPLVDQFTVAAKAADVALFRTIDEAATAIAAAQRFTASRPPTPG
jgi:acyl-CoA synthetase (NDP forming)